MKNPYKAALSVSTVLALVAIPAAVRAGTITLDQNAYSYSVGGEFNAVTSQPIPTGYTSETAFSGGFETFCVETGVDFTPGTTYNYTTSTTTSVGQVLTLGAAYLYYEFATQNLTGYGYTTANRQTDAGELQAAIWYLMGGQTYAGYAIPTTANNAYYSLAMTMLDNAGDNATTANNGEYGVEVLNLTVTSSGAPAQNQLELTGSGITSNGSPVPDGGTTLLLLGAALSGLTLVKRKLTA